MKTPEEIALVAIRASNETLTYWERKYRAIKKPTKRNKESASRQLVRAREWMRNLAQYRVE